MNNPRITVLITIIISTFCSCSSLEKESIDAPKVKEEFTKEFYNGTDQLRFEGHKKDGKPDGFCKFYHENGKLKIEAHYQFGKFEGFYKSFYSNGQLKEEGHFQLGEKTGLWKFFSEEGKLLWEENL